MRRWNGWGDESVLSRIPEEASAFLNKRVGHSRAIRDSSLEDALASLPESRLPRHPLIQKERLVRLRHARGQSLPDWIAMRGGQIGAAPDAVAFPESAEEIRTLLRFAKDVRAKLIPYGGGTSVAGHINVASDAEPHLTVSLARLNGLLRLDAVSGLATFGAGVAGADLEATLRAQRLTLGHFPQSFEYSTLGGWVVTRSSGQQSLGYGRIEDLFAGGVLETPAGVLELPAFPASAAGPDLKQLVLGSEGRIGILTEATVRVSPLPEREEWRAYFLPDWDRGLEAVRALAQSRLPLSMLRLSTPGETETALALSSRQQLVAVLRKVSAWRGIGGEACLLLTALTGSRRVVSAVRRSASRVIRASRGVSAGRFLAEGWRRGRFKTPYLRNTLWERGYAVDTLETAASWSLVPALLRSVESALGTALDSMGERVHVFSHVSHVYGDGASLYATYVFRRGDDAQDTLERWLVLKQAATRAIMLGGGTLSHHHGVGTDLRADLTREKGALGVEALRAAFGCFDPDNIMNPGKLLPERPFSVLGSLP